MYPKEKILKGIKDPKKILLEAHRLYNRKLRRRSGVDIMDQDWDNLIILDACRYDMFSELNEINGNLSAAISKGSSTIEFLQKNFQDEQYNDTIYISANPQVQKHNIDIKFYDRVRLWETHWDDNLRTVRPSDVVNETLSINQENPHKKLIIHFIQPHYPFIGKKGKQIEHKTVTGDGIIYEDRNRDDVWTKLERGNLSKKLVWEAYLENLELTLPHVENLVNNLVGKSIVTSDHGNALGRWGLYGHPGRKYIEELVKVPWLVIDDSTRRQITSEKIYKQSDIDSTVNERLKELGYA